DGGCRIPGCCRRRGRRPGRRVPAPARRARGRDRRRCPRLDPAAAPARGRGRHRGRGGRCRRAAPLPGPAARSAVGQRTPARRAARAPGAAPGRRGAAGRRRCGDGRPAGAARARAAGPRCPHAGRALRTAARAPRRGRDAGRRRRLARQLPQRGPAGAAGRTRPSLPTHRSPACSASLPTTGRMNKTLLNGLVFAIGLLVVCWIGAGYVRSHALARAVTALIAAFYLTGGFELYRYRQATGSLVAALQAPPEPPAALADWLGRLDPTLRTAVRQRIGNGQAALPAPSLTPYLVGML